jgi:hypothetical protein
VNEHYEDIGHRCLFRSCPSSIGEWLANGQTAAPARNRHWPELFIIINKITNGAEISRRAPARECESDARFRGVKVTSIRAGTPTWAL